jgi:hypothetical protein
MMQMKTIHHFYCAAKENETDDNELRDETESKRTKIINTQTVIRRARERENISR